MGTLVLYVYDCLGQNPPPNKLKLLVNHVSPSVYRLQPHLGLSEQHRCHRGVDSGFWTKVCIERVYMAIIPGIKFVSLKYIHRV